MFGVEISDLTTSGIVKLQVATSLPRTKCCHESGLGVFWILSCQGLVFTDSAWARNSQDGSFEPQTRPSRMVFMCWEGCLRILDAWNIGSVGSQIWLKRMLQSGTSPSAQVIHIQFRTRNEKSQLDLLMQRDRGEDLAVKA